uniref:Fcf2 pre-rRNA processing C-terminal domain-containing protein n=2 Tax=Salix viminalis TaxID=40686 RepID=A0A6N2K278_SALVM
MAEKDKGPVIGLSWHPTLPTLSSFTIKNIKIPDEAESSSALWKPNSQLVDGLFVPPNDPIKLNKLRKSQCKDTLGKDWFDMPAPTITPELKRDLQLLKLRSAIDPKRHYKRGDPKSKDLPKYFQVGTVVESATDFYSGRLTKKERKATIADELLSNQTFRAYRKRKVREIEEKNRPGGNDKWKIKGKQSRKRAKERRH